MSQDAIVMLKNDHKEIRGVFREFEKAGDNALKTKGRLVDKIIELLTVHTYIENEVMYPRVRELVPELEDDVLVHAAAIAVEELLEAVGVERRVHRGVARLGVHGAREHC